MCGHSIEINVANKLDIYAGTSQIKLLEHLAQTAASSFSGKRTKREKHSRQSPTGAPVKSEASLDSGLGSDISSVRSPGRVRSETVTGIGQGSGAKSYTPFDLLLTANVVSCSLYRNQETESGVILEEDVVIVDKADVADMGTDNRENVREKKEEGGGDSYKEVSVIPFLHLYLWQPHTVLSCHHDTQKFEISCYDVSLKGPHRDSCPTGMIYLQHQILLEIETVPVYKHVCIFMCPVPLYIHTCISMCHVPVYIHTCIFICPVSVYIHTCIFMCPLSLFAFFVTDLSKQLPDWSTYGVNWLETRPGEPNPKTGIPPSLCTLSVTDFIIQRGKWFSTVICVAFDSKSLYCSHSYSLNGFRQLIFGYYNYALVLKIRELWGGGGDLFISPKR